MKHLNTFIVLAMLCMAQALFAQASLSSSPYVQDFNTMASSGASSTMPLGWSFIENGLGANALYNVNSGTSVTGDTYSCGTASATDRGLGSVCSGSMDSVTFGAKFVNNSGTAINNPTISFTAEQWRNGGNINVQTYRFWYSTSASATLLTGAWTALTAGNMTSIVNTSGAAALNGNDAANKALKTFTLTGVSIPAGGTFWVRWRDNNDIGTDHLMAVDDFSISWSNCSPVQAFTLSAAPSVLCSNNATTLLAANTTQTGLTFSYTGNGSILQDGSVALVDNIPVGFNTYTVVASNACGQTFAANTSVIVTGSETPTFQLLDIICQGSTFLLPTNSINGIPGTWSPSIVDASIAGVFTYTFTPSAGNCATNYTHTVTVLPLPPVVLEASSAEFNCQNQAINIYTTSTGYPSYLWSDGSAAINTLAQAPGIYTLSITDDFGCINQASVTLVNNYTLSTWYYDADGDGYFGNNAPIIEACEAPMDYVAEEFAGDCEPNNASVNPMAAEICDGKDNNCDGVSELTAACVKVTPVPNVLVQGTKATFKWAASCYQTYRVQYRKTSPAGQTWILKNVNNPNATSTFVTGLTPGTYQWRVRGRCYSTNAFSPLSTGNVNFTIASAMLENQSETVASVAYPNPVRDVLNINLPTNAGVQAIRLLNVNGIEVLAQQFETDGPVSLGVDHLPAGTYFLQITGSEQTKTQQVYIVR